jgi:hypothetical protein
VTHDESDFGSYMSAPQERDIDLLLLEELHSDSEFVVWFCGQIGLADVAFLGAWHSVADVDGETDVLLRVQIGEERIGILIENKIAAIEQDRQAERYHLRGARAVVEKKFHRYMTCMCAPQRYLDGIPKHSPYTHNVSYESIAQWFERADSPRHRWRLTMLKAAIEQGRRGYTMVVDPVVTRFHADYWMYLRENHPGILMNKPGNKGRGSAWIVMKGVDFPKGVALNHKLDQQVIELGFENRTMEQLRRVKADWPHHIVPVPKGRISALCIHVPRIDIRSSLSEQLDSLAVALTAAQELIPYARLFEGD